MLRLFCFVLMRFLFSLCWLLVAAAATAATAQTYPARPVRFIVPYAPGGSSDVIARILGQKLADSLGPSFVIDNRPGAGSMLGTDIAAKSAPDGYTIILSDMPHAINPSVYAKVPYDPVGDFSPITLVGTSAMFLFVHPSVQAQSVKELIALAKAQPGKLAIGSGGNGTTTHLSAELFQIRTGIRLTHVPYKGAGPALVDVVAGQIPATFTSMATAAPFVMAGKLRVLGVTSVKRLAALPDVPTFAESGVADFVVEHWWGVLAPAGVAPVVVARLHDEIVKVVGSADVRERFDALAVRPTTNTPEQFRALLASDVSRWARVVREAGVTPN
ncbi:MAG TPA: tripartite tricarboxylate transporter substrate binding protein [Burkholderiales bacterium]|nr:tripartite tricarboxylate transporter substrate binding protein [Burkholderiales bacterium]